MRDRALDDSSAMSTGLGDSRPGRRPQRPGDIGRFVLISLGALLAILLLSIILVTGVLIPTVGIGPSPPPTPIGTAFAMTGSRAGNCTTQLVDLGLCISVGNLVYIVQIGASTITFGSVNFEIQVNGGGELTTPNGGEFVIATGNLNWSAGTRIAAGNPISMTSGWSRYAPGLSSSSELNTTYVIVVDLGEPGPPPTAGLDLVAVGTGGYTGTTVCSLPD